MARRTSTAWAAMRQDVAFAFRTIARAPRFAIAVVLTLGLAIGATTAMFGVVDAVLVRPLPLPGADRVVALVPRVGGEPRGGSPGLLATWRVGERSGARIAGLQAVAGLEERQLTLRTREGAERVAALAVDRGFFTVLGTRPTIGRPLLEADDVGGAPAVVVLSHRLWSRAFGADSTLVGRAIVLDGVSRTVVGVMPPAAAEALGARDVVLPLALAQSQDDNFTPYLTIIARLAPGARADEVARRLTALVPPRGARAAEDGVYPVVQALPLHEWLGADYRTPLALMLAAVVVVLAIGCANVATLVLVRSVSRGRELAVRAALGAGHGRLVRQLVVEHLVLGLFATLVALPLASAGTRALVALAPVDIPRLATARLDLRALAVAVVSGLATSLLCGLAAVLHQRGLDVGARLRGARGSGDAAGQRWRRVLVTAEVALAVVLLAGAGLLVRSAAALGRVEPGFDVARVQTARLALPQRDYPELERTVATFERVVEATRALPGVRGAGLVSRVPLGGSMTGIDVMPAGVAPGRVTPTNTAFRVTSAGYFGAIGIPLLAGRDLRASDDARAASVAIVNLALARRLGGGDAMAAIGRRITSDNAAFRDGDGRPREMEIVGVVGDVLDGGPRSAPQPELYLPMGQVSREPWDYWIGRELVLVVRMTADPAAIVPAMRRAVASVDPGVPLYDVRSTGARLGDALAVEKFSTRMLALLGLAGLALAALGIHAVIAYSASLRARDVGIRLALGATASRVVGHAVRDGMRPVVAGLVIGLPLAIVLARAARPLLFGVAPADPLTLLLAGALLALVGVVACLGPARRLAAVDPVLALRSE